MSIRTSAIFLAAVGAAYVGLWLALDSLPLLDLPNHLARATILGDLWLDGGRRFGDAFEADLRLAPYILGDVLLAPLTHWLPADVAGRLWLVLLFVGLPLAVDAFLRAFGYRGWQRVAGAGIALFLATDWFFVVGFGAFRLGTIGALFALAAWRAAVDRGGWNFAGFAGLVLACYLAHLASFVMLGVAAGVLTVLELARRRVTLRAAAALGAPFLALIVHYLTLGHGEMQGVVTTGSASEKVVRLAAQFVRFDARLDLVLVAALCGALLWSIRHSRAGDASARSFLLLAAVYVALYAVMPIGSGSVYDIDIRALPFAAMFGAFAALSRLDPDRPPPAAAVAIVGVVLLVNLGYLAAHLVPENARAREYRSVVATLPAGAAFLPIVTVPAVGRTQPLLHAYAWATIERGAVAPYLFSATRGDSMIHFRYRRRGVEPGIFWYVRNGDAPDWRRVAHDYPLLVITEPVDMRRIGVAGQWRTRSPVASVFEVTGPTRNDDAPAQVDGRLPAT